MFLLKTNYRKNILILIIASILLGTVLVMAGGYITDNYFVNMVSGIIGDYGEYDLLFTIQSDKEDIAIKQIEKIAAETLPGSIFKTGPKVAGSSNYLLKLPDKYKNEETYVNLGKYFSDIPGLMSKTIMTEPRLSVRGFRGDTRPVIRPLIEQVEGIDFIYPTGDGLDVIVQKPELVPDVKKKITEILNKYRTLEIRYPLNQHPENLPEIKQQVFNIAKEELTDVIDITIDNDSERVSLLTSLNQMKTFLLSYATKVVVNSDSAIQVATGSRLIAIPEEGVRLELEVIENIDGKITALIQQGPGANTELKNINVYLPAYGTQELELLGRGEVNNPRQELATALQTLNEITPNLNGFLDLSEQLVEFSDRMSKDLANVNDGLNQLKQTSQELSHSLEEWKQEGLSNFLGELLGILSDIKTNVGDITDIQRDLVTTSNKLKEGAGLIEEKIAFVPRNNSVYQQLDDLKNIFLGVASGLDSNYDLVAARIEDMDPVLNSIGDWETKINSLLKVEDTLTTGADWQNVEQIIGKIDQTAQIINTSDIQDKLAAIQELLIELKTSQLPVVLDQLTYIQNSLPDMKETEIVETINLIDSYIAGQVIPGDQIQLLLEGKYNSRELVDKMRGVINNPAVSYLEMDAGMMQPNPRGEIFNVLSQVKAVISTIIALVFTILVMILDQTLLISVIRFNGGNGYFYGFFSGGLIFSLICFLSRINFPYLNLQIEFIIGGILGLIMALFASMLNPVNREEWEAGKALGFSTTEIMQEIMVPAGKPGMLYLMNYPKMIFKK